MSGEQGQGGRDGYSCGCKVLVGCCCCCVLPLAVLGVVAAVLYSRLEEPTIDIAGASFKEFEFRSFQFFVPTEVDMLVDVVVRVDNPSRPPWDFSLRGMVTELYSVETNPTAPGGVPIKLADMPLNGTREIPAETVTEIHLVSTSESEHVSDLTLVRRLFDDCNPLTGSGETLLRMHVKKAFVEALTVEVNLDDLHFDFGVPCSVV